MTLNAQHTNIHFYSILEVDNRVSVPPPQVQCLWHDHLEYKYIHVGEYENSKVDQMRRLCCVCVYVQTTRAHAMLYVLTLLLKFIITLGGGDLDYLLPVGW